MLEKIPLAPYYLTLKIRHALYDKGIRKVHTPDVPTVCVGNITAGGTGKTPHTEMILRSLLRSDDWGMREIAVLSRGYKRRSKGFQQVDRRGTADFCGDEPLQIKKKFPGVTVAVDKDRIEGCRFLTHPEELQTSKKARRCENKDMRPADVIVLDDAFQFRALKASFNIVLVDWNRPIYKDKLLPFGRLRDLPERLFKADVVIVTKCPVYLEDWERADWLKPLGIKNFNPETCEGETKKGKKITVLFTSINYCPWSRSTRNGAIPGTSTRKWPSCSPASPRIRRSGGTSPTGTRSSGGSPSPTTTGTPASISGTFPPLPSPTRPPSSSRRRRTRCVSWTTRRCRSLCRSDSSRSRSRSPS